MKESCKKNNEVLEEIKNDLPNIKSELVKRCIVNGLNDAFWSAGFCDTCKLTVLEFIKDNFKLPESELADINYAITNKTYLSEKQIGYNVNDLLQKSKFN